MILSARRGAGYYYNARWYDSTLGRWISPDTVEPDISKGAQAWERYAYVNNNPLKNIDPSGHWGFNFSLSNVVNSVMTSVLGWKGSDVVDALDKWSTILDTTAFAIDTGIAIGDSVAVATAISGPQTACVALGAYESSPPIRTGSMVGNILSSFSTGLTAMSDLLSGETDIKYSLSGKEEGINVSYEASLGTDTAISYLSATAGWVLPIGIFAAPNAAVPFLNDYGFFDKLLPDTAAYIRIGNNNNKKEKETKR